MLRRAAACLALAAAPVLALDTPQWPPPESVEARMRELQLVIIARESKPSQREAAREELVGLLKSPAGRLRDPGTPQRPAARAAIDPYPSVVAPVNIAPAPRPPGGVAHIEVIQPPKAYLDPRTGRIVPR